MNVAAAHDDVVKRRNLVKDAKDHSADDGEGKKETDGGKKEAAARAVGYMVVQKRAQSSALKKREQKRDHDQENYEKKCGIIQLQVHGTLDPSPDVNSNSMRLAIEQGPIEGCGIECSGIECHS